jgi:hypothetical protein
MWHSVIDFVRINQTAQHVGNIVASFGDVFVQVARLIRSKLSSVAYDCIIKLIFCLWVHAEAFIGAKFGALKYEQNINLLISCNIGKTCRHTNWCVMVRPYESKRQNSPKQQFSFRDSTAQMIKVKDEAMPICFLWRCLHIRSSEASNCELLLHDLEHRIKRSGFEVSQSIYWLGFWPDEWSLIFDKAKKSFSLCRDWLLGNPTSYTTGTGRCFHGRTAAGSWSRLVDCEYLKRVFPLGKMMFGQGTKATARFQASAAGYLGFSCVVTRRILVVGYRRFGATYRCVIRGWIEYETDRVSRNVGN